MVTVMAHLEVDLDLPVVVLDLADLDLDQVDPEEPDMDPVEVTMGLVLDLVLDLVMDQELVDTELVQEAWVLEEGLRLDQKDLLDLVGVDLEVPQ